ncbi:MAG: 50S ribosomal protein L4 [Actinomycetota bacterium]|nr:50S ribosomal protein L4 [Actinomycetota bacterium]
MAQDTLKGGLDVELPVDIFDVQVNIPLIHQVVVAQLAAARQGTHSTKNRGEVAGGGRKPYRQKGTGRARQGSIRAPQFNGGGTVHGPKPRDYSQRTPKKMIAAALRGALSDRVRSGRVHVVDFLVEGDKPSTKNAVDALFQLTQRPRVLVVVDREDTVTPLSLRNIHDLVLLPFDQLNTYDVLLSDDIVFTKAAYDGFVAARSAEGVETIKLSKAATDVAEKGAAKPAAKTAAKKAPAKKAAKTAEPKAERKAAAAAKLVDAPAAATTEEAPAATKTQPYGPGSKAPLKSGNAPKGFDIKGNVDSMKYHTTESQWYEQTVAEVWFDTVESAEAAGFTAPGGDDK